MSDNIIHFKTAKKRAGYAQKAKQAAENRIKFGRRKTDKIKDKIEAKKLKDHIEAHQLDDE